MAARRRCARHAGRPLLLCLRLPQFQFQPLLRFQYRLLLLRANQLDNALTVTDPSGGGGRLADRADFVFQRSQQRLKLILLQFGCHPATEIGAGIKEAIDDLARRL